MEQKRDYFCFVTQYFIPMFLSFRLFGALANPTYPVWNEDSMEPVGCKRAQWPVLNRKICCQKLNYCVLEEEIFGYVPKKMMRIELSSFQLLLMQNYFTTCYFDAILPSFPWSFKSCLIYGSYIYDLAQTTATGTVYSLHESSLLIFTAYQTCQVLVISECPKLVKSKDFRLFLSLPTGSCLFT